MGTMLQLEKSSLLCCYYVSKWLPCILVITRMKRSVKDSKDHKENQELCGNLNIAGHAYVSDHMMPNE